jgi:hypothetical protein
MIKVKDQGKVTIGETDVTRKISIGCFHEWKVIKLQSVNKTYYLERCLYCARVRFA